MVYCKQIHGERNGNMVLSYTNEEKLYYCISSLPQKAIMMNGMPAGRIRITRIMNMTSVA